MVIYDYGMQDYEYTPSPPKMVRSRRYMLHVFIFSFGLASVGNDAVKCATHMPSLKHIPTVPIVSMGKEGRTLIGPLGYLNRKLPFIALP